MSRARSQAGFTVIEVLVAAVILSIVASGAMKFIDVLLHQSRGVVERTDAMQRGRLALDKITRSLRSQVCLNETTEGLVSGTPTQVTFYADYGDGTKPPELRTLTYDAAARRLTQSSIPGTGPVTGPVTFTSPPRVERLLDGVLPGRVLPDGTPEVFQYYAFGSGNPRLPDALLASPLSPTDRDSTALVKVTFFAGGFRDGSALDARYRTRLEDDVLLRNTDPNAARPDPTCR